MTVLHTRRGGRGEKLESHVNELGDAGDHHYYSTKLYDILHLKYLTMLTQGNAHTIMDSENKNNERGGA